MSISCNAINNQERAGKVYRNGYEETLDFSTSSNYLIAKVEKSDYDTITVVIPSEILGRYLRDDYPSDKSYAEAVIKAKKQNSYLSVPPEIYEAFKNYRVNFTDSLFAYWNSKSTSDLIDSFFHSKNGRFYSCFKGVLVKNQICYLLIERGMSLFKDDETGCVILGRY